MRVLNYIGSKTKLIPFIKYVLEDNEIVDGRFADLFAGTGVVGLHMKDMFAVTSNDIEYYSYIINRALLTCVYSSRLGNIIDELNSIEVVDDECGVHNGGGGGGGYDGDIHLISKHYSEWGDCKRLFWSKENALKADLIMRWIMNSKEMGELVEEEVVFLIASLIVSLDKVANTTSVYGAYLKKLKTSAVKPLVLEPIHTTTEFMYENEVFNLDVIDIVGSGCGCGSEGGSEEFDVVYLDPPYNNRQYGANYGPLNFIAHYDASIEPYGKTGLMPGYYKSDFSIKRKACDTMRCLIDGLNTSKIMISYNNEGIICEDDFKALLCEFGSVTLYMKEYTRYKSNNKKQTADKVYEYLYFLDKDGECGGDVEEVVVDC